MRFHTTVSGEERWFTDKDCCGSNPFCSPHGCGGGAKYYLVRVKDGSATGVVCPDGVCVQDAWGLGGLDGLQHVLLRYLITAEVAGRADGCGSIISSSSSSWSGTSQMDSGCSTGVAATAHLVVSDEAAVSAGTVDRESTPLLAASGAGYGSCAKDIESIAHPRQ